LRCSAFHACRQGEAGTCRKGAVHAACLISASSGSLMQQYSPVAHRRMPCCRCCPALPSTAGHQHRRRCRRRCPRRCRCHRYWQAALLRAPMPPLPLPGRPPAAAPSTCLLSVLPQSSGVAAHSLLRGQQCSSRQHRCGGAGCRR
jgi:hypothetical protein